MKKILIGCVLFNVFLYTGMTDGVWNAMEAWQHGWWLLFMFIGQLTLFGMLIMFLGGYRPRNLRKEIEALRIRNVIEKTKVSILEDQIDRLRNTD